MFNEINITKIKACSWDYSMFRYCLGSLVNKILHFGMRVLRPCLSRCLCANRSLVRVSAFPSLPCQRPSEPKNHHASLIGISIRADTWTAVCPPISPMKHHHFRMSKSPLMILTNPPFLQARLLPTKTEVRNETNFCWSCSCCWCIILPPFGWSHWYHRGILSLNHHWIKGKCSFLKVHLQTNPWFIFLVISCYIYPPVMTNSLLLKMAQSK